MTVQHSNSFQVVSLADLCHFSFLTVTKSFASENSILQSESDSGSEVLFQARRSTQANGVPGVSKSSDKHQHAGKKQGRRLDETHRHRSSNGGATDSHETNGTLVSLPPPPLPAPPGGVTIFVPEVVVDDSGGDVVSFRDAATDGGRAGETLNLLA